MIISFLSYSKHAIKFAAMKLAHLKTILALDALLF